MIKYKLIGLTGTAGAGKDTVYNILKDKYSKGNEDITLCTKKIAFASPMRKCLSVLLNISEEDFNKTEVKQSINQYGITNRKSLQLFADHMKELFHPNIFNDIAEISIKKALNDKLFVIITDTRFPHEVDIVKRYGGKIVKINRNIDILGADKNHPSEIGVADEDVDIFINNFGSIEDLKQEAINKLCI